ncbi:MAG: hypothetical protein JRG79_11885 [Deltaproteobacteria bacterium]|nr:hypothetical protein [Deltaproteobacteria bacterium]MBW2207603.1 hypothetical protein [Deltaproteobacteria bacterium]
MRNITVKWSSIPGYEHGLLTGRLDLPVVCDRCSKPFMVTLEWNIREKIVQCFECGFLIHLGAETL